jgi:lambda repressor-like predicted transcriptional regulator
MQHHAIVDRGLELTTQWPSGKAEHTAATYQWIDFQNQPTLTSQPCRLIAAKSCAAFEHIAICHLGPEEHLTTLVMDVQEEKTVGIVLVHTSDLPACGLQPTPCNEIKVPVVLIRYELGNDLLKVIQDTSVNVLAVILKDSPAAADSVPEYQVSCNPAVATASGTKPGKLLLTKRLVELLYERSTRQPAVMCQNTHNFIGTFDLVNEFERRITSGYYSVSKLKNKGKTICSHLTKCMEQNYAADFLYHCLMAHWFQLCSAYHTNDHVLKYCNDCVLKLHTLKASSMKSVFLSFLENQLTITWKSGKELAAELLLMFFEEVYASRHLQQKCQSNRSVADFGISLAAAELSLALKQYLKHTFNPVTFWKTFIQVVWCCS